jgi:hypothetical protein
MIRAFFVVLLYAHVLQAGGDTAAEVLAKAARNGDVKAIESMLASGVGPDVPDRFGHTPLYYAVSFNQNQAVELLLAHHADPSPRAIPLRVRCLTLRCKTRLNWETGVLPRC